MPPSTLDIVLPCYNPRSDWAEQIVNSHNKISTAFNDCVVSLIIVNDGSQKNVDEKIIEKLKSKISNLQFISYPANMGKGFALRKGAAAASSEICIYTDIDFPYEEKSLIALYENLKSGKADIVIGVRSKDYYDHVPAMRRVISRFLRWMIRNLLNIPITDTQGGLKGFNKKGKEIFLQTTINRYLFDLQFIYLASKRKDIQMTAQEVRLKDGVIFSRMNPCVLFRESLNFLKILFSK